MESAHFMLHRIHRITHAVTLMETAPYHENDGGIGDELNANGQALALFHAEAAHARHPHQGALQGRQLHQLQHLHAAPHHVSACMQGGQPSETC